MNIKRSKIDKQTSKIIIELIQYEDDNIFVLATLKLDDDSYRSTLYYCTYADAFGFKYNPEGTTILETNKGKIVRSVHQTAKDKLFFAYEKDPKRYERILNALKD